MTASSRTILTLLNLVAFVGVVTVNALANVLPINGRTTGELSDLYPNLFVPAGITFAIWGLIYLLLLAFVLYQVRSLFGPAPDRTIDRIGGWFLLSSLANMSWIVAWHYEQVFLSLLIMLVLLSSLLQIYLRLDIGRADAPVPEKVFVHIPFSVYLGWITVATIANVTALLVDLGWNGFGLSDLFWTILVILIGTGIALAMLRRHGDIFIVLVVIWAYAGIVLRLITIDSEPETALLITLAATILVLAYGVVTRARRWYQTS